MDASWTKPRDAAARLEGRAAVARAVLGDEADVVSVAEVFDATGVEVGAREAVEGE